MLRAAGASAGGTLGSLALIAVGTKLVALVLGPAGIGLLGALRQVQQTGATCATLGGQAALVQGLASREGERRTEYLRAALRTSLACGTLTLVVLLVAASPLASWMTGSAAPGHVRVLRLMAIPVALAAAHALLGAVLAARGARVRLGLAQIAGAAAFALLAWPCALLARDGHDEFLAGMLAALSGVSAAVAWWWARREGWLALPATGASGGEVLAHLRTAGALMAAQVVAGGALLTLRGLVVSWGGGLPQAGHFDAAWSVGMTYMTVTLVALNTYYLPELARRQDAAARGRLIGAMTWFMLACTVPIITGMIAARPFVLTLLYSSEFLPALDLLRWMLLGDFFKMLAWVFGIPLLAAGELRAMLVRETAWNAVFLGGSAVALGLGGSLEGVGAAFLAAYALLAAANAARAARRHGFRWSSGLALYALSGLALVAAASAWEWSSREADPLRIAAWIAAGLAYATAGAWVLRRQGAASG